eukprot:840913-Alexandrium_andersonii.AAC.1
MLRPIDASAPPQRRRTYELHACCGALPAPPTAEPSAAERMRTVARGRVGQSQTSSNKCMAGLQHA